MRHSFSFILTNSSENLGGGKKTDHKKKTWKSQDNYNVLIR